LRLTSTVNSATKQDSQESFGRKHRLNDSGLIKKVREAGRKIYKSRFLIYRHSNSLGYPRIAIALTRMAGPSVLRNRVRRKLREFFRKRKQALGSNDYFIYASRNLSRITNEEWKKILQEIESTCEKSK
jgi:ribonuclease P protein component